jgi:GT2 family glycosyltransferase
MDLSIIIVNYNVKFFLEQCLYSVRKSLSGIDGEVIIIDNNSVDDSAQMLKEKFSEYTLIENQENIGFSRANNQGIRQSKGKYVLLLNPDTVIQEDTLNKCLGFMDSNPDAGALGVKMIDGKGRFLPESKRALPKPDVAFYKIFGLSRLFPKSRIFGKYNLGYLSPDETHEIEILPGAFMFIRKTVLDETGLLDETFFMYGEDIDLSYRINLKGYKNYYFPETTIIHYKGESTKKGSLNYVKMFYKAMLIFAKKHFSKRNAKLFSIIIKIAIYFRAGLSILRRIFNSILLPFFDFILIYLGYHIIIPWWENKLFEGGRYPPEFLYYIVPGYISIWILTNLLYGGYDKPIKIGRHITGLLAGSAVILIIYALLPLDLRFSRVLILMGTFWAIISTVLLRYILNFFGKESFKIYHTKDKKLLISGSQSEIERILGLINEVNLKPKEVYYVSPPGSEHLPGYKGNFNQIPEIVHFYNLDEVIFSAKDIPSKEIITKMVQMSGMPHLEFKIAPPSSYSVIGSNSIHSAGDLYFIDINSISKPRNRRLKRLFDLGISLFFIPLSLFLFLFIENPLGFFKNIFIVISGKKSWVGYNLGEISDNAYLPSIKPGVLTPVDSIKIKESGYSKVADSMNVAYARNYRILTDFMIIFKGYKYLGRQ